MLSVTTHTHTLLKTPRENFRWRRICYGVIYYGLDDGNGFTGVYLAHFIEYVYYVQIFTCQSYHNKVALKEKEKTKCSHQHAIVFGLRLHLNVLSLIVLLLYIWK